MEIPSGTTVKTKNQEKKHTIEPFTHEERAHMKNKIRDLEKKLEK